MDLTEQAIEKLLATGRGQNQMVDTIDGDAYAITPAGTVLDLAGRYPPKYIKQTVTLLDARSFAEYVNRFKMMETLLFADITPSAAKLTAVIDYHQSNQDDEHVAQRGCHRAVFTTKATPEWEAWQAANRKHMNQVEFATWIEDNMQLFVSPEGSGAPTGSELLELVRTLHGHQNARFNTNLRLDNGAYSVAYDEDVEIKGTILSKPGSLQLPPLIMGGFAVFEGAAAYQVPARLKTRISERRLQLYFETIALHKIVRESVDAIVAQVAEATKITPLLGSPN